MTDKQQGLRDLNYKKVTGINKGTLQVEGW